MKARFVDGSAFLGKPYTVEQLATALLVHFRINAHKNGQQCRAVQLSSVQFNPQRRLLESRSLWPRRQGHRMIRNVRFWHKADIGLTDLSQVKFCQCEL
jgi:hypothetical protein